MFNGLGFLLPDPSRMFDKYLLTEGREGYAHPRATQGVFLTPTPCPQQTKSRVLQSWEMGVDVSVWPTADFPQAPGKSGPNELAVGHHRTGSSVRSLTQGRNKRSHKDTRGRPASAIPKDANRPDLMENISLQGTIPEERAIPCSYLTRTPGAWPRPARGHSPGGGSSGESHLCPTSRPCSDPGIQ